MWTPGVQTLWMKYIGIVDDYSGIPLGQVFEIKDENSNGCHQLLIQIQVSHKIVRFIRTDNRTKFVNKTLYDYYESVGIFHQKTVPRTPQQNDVVERRNQTLVRGSRTNAYSFKGPDVSLAEMRGYACYTQKRCKVGSSALGSSSPVIPTGPSRSMSLDSRRTFGKITSYHWIIILIVTHGVAVLSNGCENGILKWRSSKKKSMFTTDGFVDQKERPHYVYRSEESTYGVKTGSTGSWYDTLLKFLLAQGFFKGVVDPTLFIQKTGKHTLHVQIYVDDIRFARKSQRL
ncbi:retrovirus-related pol polyprotein from transposon TNT 1-94 [Tanacetum coccineum]